MSMKGKYSGKHVAPEDKASAETFHTMVKVPVEAQTKEEPKEEKEMKEKKISTGLKIAIGIVCAIVLIAAVGFGFVRAKLGQLNYDNVRTAETDKTVSDDADGGVTPRQDKDVMNILLIGVDNDNLAGMEARGNADGLMLLSVNTKTKQIVLTSIMRDISIKVPDKYRTKITLVYRDFGTETLIDTIEYNFGITIDNYALVNYLNVIEIFDALGGLDMEISKGEINGMNSKMDNLNSLTGDPKGTDFLSAEDEGMTHLNGKQIAALLRIRNVGGNDEGRTERARKIILAAKDRVSEMGLVELNSFSDVVLKNITTDITANEALGLLAQVPAYLKYEFVSNRIPIDGSYTSDGSYIYVDYEENIAALHKAVFGDEE